MARFLDHRDFPAPLLSTGGKRKWKMKYACTYCGYHSLKIVRDYTGAPYGQCQRCYRRDPFYRFKPVSQPMEKTPDTQLSASSRNSVISLMPTYALE
jgi:hypothetical protein